MASGRGVGHLHSMANPKRGSQVSFFTPTVHAVLNRCILAKYLILPKSIGRNSSLFQIFSTNERNGSTIRCPVRVITVLLSKDLAGAIVK